MFKKKTSMINDLNQQRPPESKISQQALFAAGGRANKTRLRELPKLVKKNESEA